VLTLGDASRNCRHASRIAFKIAIDACNRLGQWFGCVFTLSSSIVGNEAPDNQRISDDVCWSESTADVAVSGWKSWQAQSSTRQELRLGSLLVGVATNRVRPFVDIILRSLYDVYQYR
jgi:hypothetical protein